MCNDDGSRDITCDDNTGKCTCKTNVIGDKCDFCTPGNTGFPACHGMYCLQFDNQTWLSKHLCLIWINDQPSSFTIWIIQNWI